MDIKTVLFAFLGGVVPALVWVWFWRREDSDHPEPLKLIFIAFVVGMLTVALVIPFQKLAASFLSGTIMLLAWAMIEELAKFLTASSTILSSKENNEPIDSLIYMITISLGFAAAENALFLLTPIQSEGFIQSILTGNFRFLGATLLHVLASSVVGTALALSFHRKGLVKFLYISTGLILAILLHGAFNLLILGSADEHILRIFALVWLGLVGLLMVFEFIKSRDNK